MANSPSELIRQKCRIMTSLWQCRITEAMPIRRLKEVVGLTSQDLSAIYIGVAIVLTGVLEGGAVVVWRA